MAFQREDLHGNGSGRDSRDNGGNLWVYRPTNGDSLATIRTADYFLPFQEGLEVGDLMLIVATLTTIGLSSISTSVKTSIQLSTLTVTA